MMYSGAGSRLDEKHASPHWRLDAGRWMNSGKAPRTGSLRSRGVELPWTDDTNEFLLHKLSLNTVFAIDQINAKLGPRFVTGDKRSNSGQV
jgi:hypothetical protein